MPKNSATEREMAEALAAGSGGLVQVVTVVFTGGTGTGKTTALNALARMIEAAGGHVHAQESVNKLTFVLDGNNAYCKLDNMHRVNNDGKLT